jgi:hypothetical protein
MPEVKYNHPLFGTMPYLLKDFKDGAADALLTGTRKDGALSLEYKEGYDFGIILYCEQENLVDNG